MEAFEILVVIVSITLSLFLIISIIAVFYVLKVLKQIEQLTKKAEHVADNFDKVGKFFTKTTGPVALGKLISNIVDMLRKKEKEDK